MQGLEQAGDTSLPTVSVARRLKVRWTPSTVLDTPIECAGHISIHQHTSWTHLPASARFLDTPIDGCESVLYTPRQLSCTGVPR